MWMRVWPMLASSSSSQCFGAKADLLFTHECCSTALDGGKRGCTAAAPGTTDVDANDSTAYNLYDYATTAEMCSVLHLRACWRNRPSPEPGVMRTLTAHAFVMVTRQPVFTLSFSRYAVLRPPYMVLLLDVGDCRRCYGSRV